MCWLVHIHCCFCRIDFNHIMQSCAVPRRRAEQPVRRCTRLAVDILPEDEIASCALCHFQHGFEPNGYEPGLQATLLQGLPRARRGYRTLGGEMIWKQPPPPEHVCRIYEDDDLPSDQSALYDELFGRTVR